MAVYKQLPASTRRTADAAGLAAIPEPAHQYAAAE